jgi:hypothetical protein
VAVTVGVTAWVLWDGTYRIPGSPAYEPTLNSPVSMDGHRSVLVVLERDMDTVVAPLGRCDIRPRERVPRMVDTAGCNVPYALEPTESGIAVHKLADLRQHAEKCY